LRRLWRYSVLPVFKLYRKNNLAIFPSIPEVLFMDEAMNDILLQAEELGRLIHDTDVYRDYISISESLNADGESVRLLEEYMTLSRSLKERQDMSDIIEKYEFENMESLAGLVSENETIIAYLKAQKEYLGLLKRIQEELADTGFPQD
jgi:cell fate (sporulation/competence/biofilm development) regulator YlbF (YheA/YmcA/DUF963 family)